MSEQEWLHSAESVVAISYVLAECKTGERKDAAVLNSSPLTELVVRIAVPSLFGL